MPQSRLGLRKSMIALTIALLAASLLVDQRQPLLHPLRGGHRQLLLDDPKSAQGKTFDENTSPHVYTHDECPDNNHPNFDSFLHKGINPDGANMLSFLSGALTTVSETLADLRDTKIVLIGDSVMHQIYLSLSCMSHKSGAWEADTSFVGDRRVWLKNNNQIIFSNWAGNLLQFDWNKRMLDQPPADNIDPFYDNTDWIEACEKREPFQQVTYSKVANPNILNSETENDHSFEEKIMLTSHDKVFVYGTLHNRGVHSRIENMQRLHRLFQCMEEAKSSNEDPGWPEITYIATPAQHFPGHADGHWSGYTETSLSCRKTVNLSHNQFYKEENQLELEGKISIIGREIDTSTMGEFHLGLSNRQQVVDCTHWSMPGVTDLYAKEIMKSIAKVKV